MKYVDSSGYREVFEHFQVAESDRPLESYYAYSPVFQTVVNNVPAAIKRTRSRDSAVAIMDWTRALRAGGVLSVVPIKCPVENPVLVGDEMWVAYPWIDGRLYDGSNVDIAAAGDLLGRVHATPFEDQGMPEFEWPESTEEEVAGEIAQLNSVLGEHAPEIPGARLSKMAMRHRTFATSTLPKIRDSRLPVVVGSTDFKANNLVYGTLGPVLIDPDNADRLPRVIDLAMAALLFHNEMVSAPPRLFSSEEWAIFRRAYRRHIELSELELRLWPLAVEYLLSEWGTWTFVDAAENGDWADPHKRAFLVDLALTDMDRFSLW